MDVFIVSAATRVGLRELTFAMAGVVESARAFAPEGEPERIVIRPRAVDEEQFTVVLEGDRYRVRGIKPERWVRQTDFTNDEAVGFLADRLAKLGVEDKLVALGAEPGVEVIIGGDDGWVFDWEPTIDTGAGVMGPRGTDLRLEGR